MKLTLSYTRQTAGISQLSEKLEQLHRRSIRHKIAVATILNDGRQKSSTDVRHIHRGQPHLRGEVADVYTVNRLFNSCLDSLQHFFVHVRVQS